MIAKKQVLLKQSTLVLMLFIFACQLLSTTNMTSVQYPSGEHPMGIELSHHHSHAHEHILEQSNDIIKNLDPEVTQHEHANHSHTVYFLPSTLALTSIHYQSQSVISSNKAYNPLIYAPPIPPPTV